MTESPMPPKAPEHGALCAGAVSYLNMAPLIAGLDAWRGEGFDLKLAPPSRLTALLEAGGADLAMAPVAGLIRHPAWGVANRNMIGCRGPVASVALLSREAPERWRTLRPDAQSMTSNALAQVLLRRAMGLEIEIGDPLPFDAAQPPAAPAPGEVFVAIGSRALLWRAPWGGATHRIDMGRAWVEWTGLPFVFALWAVRPGARLGGWPARMEIALEKNMARIDEIARAFADPARDGLDAAGAERYLRENVDFHFDEAARAGLVRFYEEGLGLGLFPEGWRLKIGDRQNEE